MCCWLAVAGPRPLRRAGATSALAESVLGWATDVSILARSEERALPLQIASPISGVFQSSPAPKGGRYVDVRIYHGMHK